MSLKYRNGSGVETPVAGLNGTSGELVPSVSVIRSGSYTPSGSVQVQEDLSFSVTFDTPMPDNDYQVIFGSSSNSTASGTIQCAVRSRTTTGFTGVIRNVGIDPVSELSGTFTWFAFKLMTDEDRALDEQAIADLQAVVPSVATSTNKLIANSQRFASVEIPATSGAPAWRRISFTNCQGVTLLIGARGGERAILAIPKNASWSNDKAVQGGYTFTCLDKSFEKILDVRFDYTNFYLYIQLAGYSDPCVITQIDGNPNFTATYEDTTAPGSIDTITLTKRVLVANSDRIAFADVSSIADIRALSSDRIYILRTTADILLQDDGGQSCTIVAGSRSEAWYKIGGDEMILFYQLYPIANSHIWAVFLNSNGQNRGRVLV